MVSKAGLLRHLYDLVPIQETKDRWLINRILDDSIWNRELANSASPSERAKGDYDDKAPLSQSMHQNVFMDHSQRDMVVSNHRSILRMKSRGVMRPGQA